LKFKKKIFKAEQIKATAFWTVCFSYIGLEKYILKNNASGKRFPSSSEKLAEIQN